MRVRSILPKKKKIEITGTNYTRGRNFFVSKITKEERHLRTRDIVTRRLQGETYDDIAVEWNITANYVGRIYRREMQKLAKRNPEVEEARTEMLEKSVRMENELWQTIRTRGFARPTEINSMRGLLEFRAKLLGAYAPTEIDLNVEGHMEHEFSGLSDYELAFARMIAQHIVAGVLDVQSPEVMTLLPNLVEGEFVDQND